MQYFDSVLQKMYEASLRIPVQNVLSSLLLYVGVRCSFTVTWTGFIWEHAGGGGEYLILREMKWQEEWKKCIR